MLENAMAAGIWPYDQEYAPDEEGYDPWAIYHALRDEEEEDE